MKKLTIFLSLLLVFVTVATAQSKKISKDKYNRVFQSAVSDTNAAFPFIFTVKDETIENNKTGAQRRNSSIGYCSGR